MYQSVPSIYEGRQILQQFITILSVWLSNNEKKNSLLTYLKCMSESERLVSVMYYFQLCTYIPVAKIVSADRAQYAGRLLYFDGIVP